jgi:hypothetical protein
MRVCSVKRHESIFPFDLKENPDVIWTFECLTEGGNSGAPMLSSPDSNVVEGIHVGSIRLEKQIEFIKTEEKREPYNYEKHGTEQTTNVRCLPIPGRKNVPECVRTSAEMKSARFTRYQMAKLDERNTRPLPENLRLGFDYSVYAYDLVLPPGEHGYFFEIYYIPKCRPSPELPADVPVRIETLRMEFDEYARLSLKTVEIKTPATRVLKPNANDVYTLESRWPAAPGAFLYPDFPGLREQWGESFSIAIPRCRR